MVKKIIKAACFLLGAFILFLAIKGVTQIDDSIDSLDDAVFLETPVVLAENEGKQIIISGQVEMTKAAYDNELDIVLYTPVAERVHEVSRKKDKENQWSIKDRKYFYGEANLGEFELDQSMLKLLTKINDYSDFDEVDLEPYMTDDTLDGFYILDSLRSRYRYSHCDLEKNGEMTLVGIQKGNSIVVDDPIVAVNDGILSPDKLRQVNKGHGIIGTGLGIAFALGLMLYGLSSILFKKRTKNSKK